MLPTFNLANSQKSWNTEELFQKKNMLSNALAILAYENYKNGITHLFITLEPNDDILTAADLLTNRGELLQNRIDFVLEDISEISCFEFAHFVVELHKTQQKFSLRIIVMLGYRDVLGSYSEVVNNLQKKFLLEKLSGNVKVLRNKKSLFNHYLVLFKVSKNNYDNHKIFVVENGNSGYKFFGLWFKGAFGDSSNFPKNIVNYYKREDATWSFVYPLPAGRSRFDKTDSLLNLIFLYIADQGHFLVKGTLYLKVKKTGCSYTYEPTAGLQWVSKKRLEIKFFLSSQLPTQGGMSNQNVFFLKFFSKALKKIKTADHNYKNYEVSRHVIEFQNGVYCLQTGLFFFNKEHTMGIRSVCTKFIEAPYPFHVGAWNYKKLLFFIKFGLWKIFYILKIDA